MGNACSCKSSAGPKSPAQVEHLTQQLESNSWIDQETPFDPPSPVTDVKLQMPTFGITTQASPLRSHQPILGELLALESSGSMIAEPSNDIAEWILSRLTGAWRHRANMMTTCKAWAPTPGRWQSMCGYLEHEHLVYCPRLSVNWHQTFIECFLMRTRWEMGESVTSNR